MPEKTNIKKLQEWIQNENQTDPVYLSVFLGSNPNVSAEKIAGTVLYILLNVNSFEDCTDEEI